MKKTNIEWLKENFTEDDRETTGFLCYLAMSKISSDKCEGKDCCKCHLNKNGNLIDFLLSEYKEPEKKEPIKLTRFEYDILKIWATDFNYENEKFNDLMLTSKLKEKGYFKGVKYESMTLNTILRNCEVVEE